MILLGKLPLILVRRPIADIQKLAKIVKFLYVCSLCRFGY